MSAARSEVGGLDAPAGLPGFPMRILFLNHNVVGAGTYQRAFHFARELGRRGHDVTLATTGRSNRLEGRWNQVDGVRVLEAPDLWSGPARSGWDPWNSYRRIRLLASARFDLIHGFDCRPAVIVPGLALSRATGAPLVLDWADWWGRGGTIDERSGWVVRTLFGPVETWFEEAFRTRAVASTVISRALRQRCMRLGVPEEAILRVPNGCDAPVADGAVERSRRAYARAALGLPPGQRLVAHVGTALRRDAELLFDAVRILRGRSNGNGRHGTAPVLVLAGGFRAAAAPDLVADGALRLTGYIAREQLSLWLAAADLCVIPMRDNIANRGRWPGKINEYLSAGRATVMTRVSDAARELEEVGAGWTCDASAEGLAEAIAGALRSDDEREEAEARACALARGTLAWSRLTERLEAFYLERVHTPTAALTA